MNALHFHSPSEDCTIHLGVTIGKLLAPGDVVALRGELGAGKTLFVRGVAQGLGVPPGIRVTSPTFTIINEYSGRLYLYHLDLYRISGPNDLESLPWEESLFGSGVALIEWPERLGRFLPEDRWEISLTVAGEQSRDFTITGHGQNALRLPSWAGDLEALRRNRRCE